MKKQKYLGENYMGIPGNIYLGEDVDEREQDFLNKCERTMWIVFGFLAISVIIAQIVIHAVGR